MNNVELKSERIRLNRTKSPQQIQEEQQLAVNAAMNSFFSDSYTVDEDTDEEEDNEQNQDSKQTDKWKNPQVRGRHKPTRKGNTQEDEQEG